MQKTQKIERFKHRKLREKRVNRLIDELENLSNEELFESAKNLLINLNTKDAVNTAFNMEKYEALLKEIEQRELYEHSQSDLQTKFKYYPDYGNKNFNQEILGKKEFYIHKGEKLSNPSSDERELISKKMCDPLFDSVTGERVTDKSRIMFNLTNSQVEVLDEIKADLLKDQRMFRIIQGDVGSGKTIVSLIPVFNVIKSGYQCALMSPTEILAKQHYVFSKKIFKDDIKIEYLTGKTEYKKRKEILNNLKNQEIDLLIGTHSLFQKKIEFKNLGLVVIDEQHKFGVKQRSDLAKKGGDNCDVLLMSATPIPRTMMMSLYGDMDVSKITEKPAQRKKIITLSKPENKINEIWPFIKKQIDNSNQVFWVCPLIEESPFLDYSSAKKRFEQINKRFTNKVGLIHGALEKEEKEIVLKKFLNKEISILVSTTVIEVGIDFPNANLIVIENANKFGLAQLHQLRGRVGRGKKQGTCILLFKDGLTKNAIKRIKILKNSDDGFFIAEEDLKLRGFGDLIGFQQSGVKNFRFSDPVVHEDLFNLAEKYVQKNKNDVNQKKYAFLLKLFDRAEIINVGET